jgi:hypothetical protein
MDKSKPIISVLAALLLLCCQEGLMTSAQQQPDSKAPTEPNSPAELAAEDAEVCMMAAVSCYQLSREQHRRMRMP